MTGFEHQMLNLRGLAYSYGVDIIFSKNKVFIRKGDFNEYLEPKYYTNQMIFEETIKDFIHKFGNKTGQEVWNDYCTNPERFDLP